MIIQKIKPQDFNFTNFLKIKIGVAILLLLTTTLFPFGISHKKPVWLHFKKGTMLIHYTFHYSIFKDQKVAPFFAETELKLLKATSNPPIVYGFAQENYWYYKIELDIPKCNLNFTPPFPFKR